MLFLSVTWKILNMVSDRPIFVWLKGGPESMNMKMLSKLAFAIIPAIVMAKYPFIQNLSVTSLSFDGEYLHVSGEVKVQLTEEAWTDFGYKGDNFYWFDKWWQEQVGNKYGPFTLSSIEWTVLERTETYHRLKFTIVLEPNARIRTGKPPHPLHPLHPPHPHR